MPASTPNLRLARLLNEGGRFKVELPDQQSIDVTPDVIATLAGIGAKRPDRSPRVILRQGIYSRRHLTPGCPHRRPNPVKCAICDFPHNGGGRVERDRATIH